MSVHVCNMLYRAYIIYMCVLNAYIYIIFRIQYRQVMISLTCIYRRQIGVTDIYAECR